MENKDSNYSKQTGKDLNQLNNYRLSYRTSKAKGCLNCNSEINEYISYCKVCGSSNNEIKDEDYKVNNVKFINKDSIVTGVVSVGIIFTVSMMLKFILSVWLGEAGSVISPFQIMMFLNLSSVNIYSSAILGTGAINARIGIIVILIIPIISITIANKKFLKHKSTQSLRENVLGVGLTYGLLMALISLLASVSSSLINIIEYGVSVSSSYNIFGSFTNGFVLAAICTFINGFKAKYKSDNLYLNIFDSVIKSVGVGYLFIVIVLTIVTISDSSYLNEIGLYGYTDNLSIIVIISQLAIYMWAFANLIPITIGYKTISIYNILRSGLFLETKLIFFSMLMISLLVLLIVGFKLRENYKNKDYKPVVAFSLIYSIFMGVISIFSKVSIAGNVSLFGSESFQASVNIGFPLLLTLVSSFLFSFLVTLIGYQLNETEE